MENRVNVYNDSWIKEVAQLASSHHLVCTGKRSGLQWFGTRLIQALGHQAHSETSAIYGKLAVDFDSFCYQLCHATPWGFDMGRNMNAVVDVIRGEGSPQNKYFIFYDAQFLYLNDFKHFKNLFSIFLEVGEEFEERGQNLKVILLLEDQEKISPRRLVRHKEKYPIETLKIVQEQAGL